MALGRCHPICSLLFLLFLFGAVFPDIAANKQPSRTSRTVRTAEELQRATEEGVKLIIITDHLNLRLLSPVRNRNLSTGLLRVSSTVAIQGRCPTLPSQTAAVATPPGTCQLVIEKDLLEIAPSSTDLWLSNVHVRLMPSRRAYESAALLLHTGGTLWLTDVILEGNSFKCRGVDVAQAGSKRRSLYASDTVFTGFSQDYGAAVRVGDQVSAVIDSCSFVSNEVSRGDATTKALKGPALYAAPGTSVRLREPVFTANAVDGRPTPTPVAISANSACSAEPAVQAHNAGTGDAVWCEPIRGPDGVLLPEGAPQRFMDIRAALDAITGQTSPGLPTTIFSADANAPPRPAPQQSRAHRSPSPKSALVAPPAGPPGTTASNSGGKRGNGLRGLIVGSVCVAVLLFGAALGGELLRRRFLQHKAAAKDRNVGAGPSETMRRTTPTHCKTTCFKHARRSSAESRCIRPPRDVTSPSHYPRSRPAPEFSPTPTWRGSVQLQPLTKPAPAYTDPPHRTLNTSMAPTNTTFTAAPSFSKTTGPTMTTLYSRSESSQEFRRMGRVELIEELNALEVLGGLFMGSFELIEGSRRGHGGQGIVQFARARGSSNEVAIKFYMEHEAFTTEQQLFQKSSLRSIMPAVTAIEPNSLGKYIGESGIPYPPCIIVERGEALDEFVRRHKPDFPTVLQILGHVAERMRQLHSEGYVHRDLKPANILWRPRSYSWTLIDFGCAARIDSEARLAFSLLYAPPETVAAYRAGSHTVKACASADVWALGVIAFELLTDAPAFPRELCSFETAVAQIAGFQALPWESAPGVMAPPPELRMLSESVCACLQREAAKRPTAEEVLEMWGQLFDRAPNHDGAP